MRKVYLVVTTRLIIRLDDDANLKEVLENLDWDYKDTTGKATIEDQEIRDWEVEDSK